MMLTQIQCFVARRTWTTPALMVLLHFDRAQEFTTIGNLHLLKTELRISDFQHFHWLVGHRLPVHLPAVPNMVKERVSNKAS